MDSFKIKKGLGRGLSSLIGDTKVNTNTNKLLVSDLIRNKLQPRKIFDEKNIEELLKKADVVLIPVLPSKFDENATTRFIAKLERMKVIRRGQRDVAIVANRLRTRNRTSRWLDDFLGDIGYPVVGKISDNQMYPQAASEGLGLADLANKKAHALLEEWDSLFDFLDEVAEAPASATGLTLSTLASMLVNLRVPGNQPAPTS